MRDDYDVIVIGGGISGVCSAIAAALEGASVLIVERYGFLGGMATAGLVNPFTPYWIWNEEGVLCRDQPVNDGIFGSLLRTLDSLGGLAEDGVTFNEEIFKIVLDRATREAKVDLLFHTMVLDVTVGEDRIVELTTGSKAGIRKLTGSVFVDASGDGDVFARAGCPFRIGRESDGACQPMTTGFRVGRVDTCKFNPKTDASRCINNLCSGYIESIYRERKAAGEVDNPRDNLLLLRSITPGTIHFNSTRVINRSALDPEDLTIAEQEGRRQAYEIWKMLRERVPGFENAAFVQTGPQIGIRESRRILGAYVVEADDLLKARKFPDRIARGSWPIEIHDPSGGGTLFRDIPRNDFYTIPYRALLPRGVRNLIVVGRCISSSHEAHSSLRVMPIAGCVGHAGGIAAAFAAREDCAMVEVPVSTIQDRLSATGGLF